MFKMFGEPMLPEKKEMGNNFRIAFFTPREQTECRSPLKNASGHFQ